MSRAIYDNDKCVHICLTFTWKSLFFLLLDWYQNVGGYSLYLFSTSFFFSILIYFFASFVLITYARTNTQKFTSTHTVEEKQRETRNKFNFPSFKFHVFLFTDCVRSALVDIKSFSFSQVSKSTSQSTIWQLP